MSMSTESNAPGNSGTSIEVDGNEISKIYLVPTNEDWSYPGKTVRLSKMEENNEQPNTNVGELSQWVEKYASLAQKFADIQEQHKELTEKYTELSDLQKEFESAKKSWEEEKAELSAKIEELNEEIKAKDAKIDEFNKTIEQMAAEERKELASQIVARKVALKLVKEEDVEAKVNELADVPKEYLSVMLKELSEIKPEKNVTMSAEASEEGQLTEEEEVRLKLFGHKEPAEEFYKIPERGGY